MPSPEKDLDSENQKQTLQTTTDLTQVDDEIEAAATMLEWRAPEHVHRPKGWWWYSGFGVVVVTLVVVFFLINNPLASIVTLMGASLVLYLSWKDPKDIRYRLMVEGVAIDNLLYPYKELDSFNIIYELGDVKVVLIRGRRLMTPLLRLEIHDADPVAIRDILLEFLPEDDGLEEPFPDVLARRLGW